MNQEKHQPSPEEVEKAEGMMGETESIMSKGREDRQKYLESLGVEGNVEISNDVRAGYDGDKDKPVWTDYMVAEINGKKIYVCRVVEEGKAESPFHSSAPKIPLSESKTDHFFGVVEADGDEVKLTHEEAEKIFRKFAPAATIDRQEIPLEKKALVELKEKGEKAKEIDDEAARNEKLVDLI